MLNSAQGATLNRSGRASAVGKYLVAATLVALTGLLVLPTTPALAASPSLACHDATSQPPFNTQRCSIPRADIGREVYLQAFPEQNEVACSEYPYTRAVIHAQLAVVRTASGFQLTGLWLQYDVGRQRYMYAEASMEDGNHNYPQGAWNNYGNFNTFDYADQITNDPIRYGASPAHPISIPWESNGHAVLMCTSGNARHLHSSEREGVTSFRSM